MNVYDFENVMSWIN